MALEPLFTTSVLNQQQLGTMPYLVLHDSREHPLLPCNRQEELHDETLEDHRSGLLPLLLRGAAPELPLLDHLSSPQKLAPLHPYSFGAPIDHQQLEFLSSLMDHLAADMPVSKP